MELTKQLYNGVEYRFDPLTNHQTRINPARAKRMRQSASGSFDRGEWIQKGMEQCPFCPQRIREVTPCFSPDFCTEGRMKAGETYVFPNVNPFSQYHAVATLSPRHFMEVDQFDETLLASNLKLSRDYFLAVHRHDHQACYPIYLWNYLPPSAGSIIHPHVQLMVEQSPIPEQKKVLKKSKRYFEGTGQNFWDELITMEKRVNERYIGEVNDIHLIASYAPRGFREVEIIMSGLSSFVELDASHIEGLAHCINTILKGYKAMGVGSFNLVSFSSGVTEKLPSFTLHFKIISRPYPRGMYTNDSGPFERLYDVWVIDTLPEMVAQTLKNFF